MTHDADASLCGDDKSRKFLEAKRDIPQINGSSNAFIAIVACLVFVIIAACVAILFLLLNQRVFETKQSRRSKREQPLNPFSNTVARPTWSSHRVMAFVGRVCQKIRNRVQKRQGGWIRAENWETDIGVSVTGPPDVREVASTGPSSVQNIHISHSLPTLSRSTSGSLSIVDVNGTRGPQMILPLSNLPNIESRLSSPSTSPQSSNVHLPTWSSESIPDHVRFDDDSREYVGSSGMLMRTLRGGTKFVEGL